MTVGWMAGLAVDRLLKLLPTGEANPADLMKALEAMTHPERTSAAMPLNELLVLDSIGMPGYGEVDALVVERRRRLRPGQDQDPGPLDERVVRQRRRRGELPRDARRSAATQAAREETCVIMGAWTHNYALGFVGALGLGALGSAVGGGIPQLHLRFYDRHLRGADHKLAPVRYFVMGAKTWREADDWPIPGTEFRRYFLRSNGHAHSAAGDGRLSLDAPASETSHRTASRTTRPIRCRRGGSASCTRAARRSPVRSSRRVSRSGATCWCTRPSRSRRTRRSSGTST